ncbi:lipopolysaccharide biosynthesis protein [Bacteroides zoogleoformans]|uniref:lipopolysaccharide biosynthesis protein n=1 Tax=Bacteroides zoogleoformans TaxID=28119 RepID=UPI00248DEB22|nr:oligosaccharide flippase family protein [Bacteroides zoogleoformans]
MSGFKKILKNKVMLYMLSRYITYALQFISTLLIAVKLGPSDFGIWSFVLLIIGVFNIIDFGISNSANVFLVHDRKDEFLEGVHIKSIIVVNVILSILVCFFFVIGGTFDIPLLKKFQAEEYYFYIMAIVVLFYFNKSFATVYRVKNRLLEVAFFQSAVPLLLFVSVIWIKRNLLHFLVWSYIVGYLFVFIVFLLGGKISTFGKFSIGDMICLVKKGFWLFMYNSAFYLIMYLSSTQVSIWYSVEEFGKYNFSGTLANAVILLVDAFSFIVFPKLIDRLSGKNYSQIVDTIRTIRLNYTTLINTLIYAILPFFYFFCIILPKYEDTGPTLCFAALAFAPYAAAFGINTFLIAQNREKRLSLISISCLIFNTMLVFIMAYFFKVNYYYIYLCVATTNIMYTLFCTKQLFSEIGRKTTFKEVFTFAFPLRQVLPYTFAILCIGFAYSIEDPVVLTIPLAFYIILNWREYKEVINSTRLIITNPSVIDLA